MYDVHIVIVILVNNNSCKDVYNVITVMTDWIVFFFKVYLEFLS